MNDPGDREGRPYISRASSEDVGATLAVAQVHNYYLTFRGCSPEIVVLSLFRLYLKAMACVAVSENS